MPRRKKPTTEERIVLDTAVGLCAWALVFEALIALEGRGFLRKKDTQRILDGAIDALLSLSKETTWHPAFAVAIEMLREQAEAWQPRKS